MFDDKKAGMLGQIMAKHFSRQMEEEFKKSEVFRAFMDTPRMYNVGKSHQRDRGVEGTDVSVGATETEPVITRARSLAGREEIFVVITHATQSFFLGKTRGIASGVDPGRIPFGSTQVLQFLTIPWPSSQDVWMFGSGAATTGLIIELRRGGR